MTNPKLSIIIPIYNVEKYLAKCLDSVLYKAKNIFVYFDRLCLPDKIKYYKKTQEFLKYISKKHSNTINDKYLKFQVELLKNSNFLKYIVTMYLLQGKSFLHTYSI